MPKTYREYDDALATRHDTLSLVAGLSQEQADYRPAPGKWSVGEVLDHLLKTDEIVAKEIRVAIRRRRKGAPLVYRGISAFGVPIPKLLRPALPFFEVPFSVFNAAVPAGVRRAVTGNRRVPAEAPGILRPQAGRDLRILQQELRDAYRDYGAQVAGAADLDLRKLWYYNPIMGLSPLPSLFSFIANHERRHQGQLRDILATVTFPAAA
ncbi:MAG: DinB family protein [Acidobacteriota bacterium]